MGHSRDCDTDSFTVDLLGVPVQCVSLEDAVAVKTVNDILTKVDPTPYRMGLVLPFVRMPDRYGRREEAKRLSPMFR